MEELKEGYVPSEIRSQHKGKEPMDVGLDDKRSEEFVPPPPPKYVAYGGSGLSMEKVEGVGLGVNKENGKPNIDPSKPKTRIQFRFHNGERSVIEFNTDHTIGDIHMYVMMAAPVDGSYSLMEGFPPKSIPEADGLSIQDAGLCDSSIV
jgi:UBX domain-containing protein 1